MLISLEWLKEFIDIEMPPHKLAEKLTMAGFEVEEIKEINGDFILEINVTPNRPDCLSILGMARELSILLNIPLKLPDYKVIEEDSDGGYRIDILAPEFCNRYTGRLITNVKVSDSPQWLKDRLNRCGIRSINNIVDITNYVLLEFGHPLHAFDADTIINKRIKIDLAGRNNKIKTLDGIDRDLPPDALLIWDDVRPIAVAGIMGGYETEVKEETKNIFLESAHFNPISIRRTSKKLNLRSESSYRFERGTDINFLKDSLDRATFLISEITGCKALKIIDKYPVEFKYVQVKVDPSYINRLLGTNLKEEEIKDMVKRFSRDTYESESYLVITPPSFRHDIRSENDVVEEIARIYGYEDIPITMPVSPMTTGRLDIRSKNLQNIKDSIRKLGYTEVINYSFMNISELDMLKIPKNDRRRNTIIISNPLSQEENLLRTTLVPSLLKNLKYNIDRGCKEIRIYELSRVFIKTEDVLPREELKIGGLLYQDRIYNLWKEDVNAFFIVKGTIECLFKELHIKGYTFKLTEEPFLHLGRSADIFISNSKVGFIGVLDPDVIESLDIKKHRPDIVIFEMDVDQILEHVPQRIIYSPIPKYPYIERDIALLVDETLPSIEILDAINDFKSSIIEDVSIFDLYKGPNIPQGKKSIGLNIIYRSKDKTLTDEEVDLVHSALVDYLIKKVNGELRG
jgi:phenylalanyl-tRNA synthetase beta chain